MSASSSGASGEPRGLLAEQRRLTGRVRAAQRATWIPLLVFAAVTLLAIPVYRFGHIAMSCRPVAAAAGPPGRVCAFYSTAGLFYWPIALVLGYVAIAAFYLRRARERGVGSRVFPYTVAGAVLAVVLGVAAGWASHHPPLPGDDVLGVHTAQLFFGLASPALAIGLALLVLAVIERNLALLPVTVVYVALVLVPPADLGWGVYFPSRWYFLPRLLIDAGVLMVAGLGFARIQRAWPRGTA